jgi:hypothetical protein
LQIFLASPFEEFAELRALLRQRIDAVPAPPLQAIDPNDNAANERPPLHRCLAAVRQAEIVILLVGERYGSVPPNQRLGYTHLQYRTALEDKKTILPFFIGRGYRNKLKQPSQDPQLAEWQREILEHHTPTFLFGDDKPDHLAEPILDHLLKRLSELFAAPTEESESAPTESDDGAGVEGSPMSEVGIDSLLEPAAPESTDPAREMLALLARPAEVAAAEHAREAHRALELGDPSGAIHHLRRALEQRPLHVERSYWLARLLTAKGTRAECSEAIRFARTAARIAQREGQTLWEAAALLIAARGATRAGDAEAGLGYAEQAVEVAPGHWATNLELAYHHAERGDASETFRIAERVFRLRPDAIAHLDHEPAVRRLGQEYDDFRAQLDERTRTQVASILESESACLALGGHAGGPAAAAVQERLARLGDLPLLDLVREGRESRGRQLDLLRAEADRLLEQVDVADREALTKLDDEVRSLTIERVRAETIAGRALPLAIVMAAVAVGTAAGGAWLLPALPGTLLLVLAAVLGGTALWFYRRHRARARLHGDVDQRLAEATRRRDGRAADFQRLVARVAAFQAAVAAFERSVLSDFLFSPRVSWQMAAADDCIRIDTERMDERYEGFEFDAALLPPRLAIVGAEDPQPPRFRLFRVVGRRGDAQVASRSAAYFPTAVPQAS